MSQSPNPNPNPNLTFDLTFIDGRDIVMDYFCAEFGNFSFSRFGFIVRTDRITEADDRYTHATTVGVSNEKVNSALDRVLDVQNC